MGFFNFPIYVAWLDFFCAEVGLLGLESFGVTQVVVLRGAGSFVRFAVFRSFDTGSPVLYFCYIFVDSDVYFVDPRICRLLVWYYA